MHIEQLHQTHSEFWYIKHLAIQFFQVYVHIFNHIHSYGGIVIHI